MIKLHFSLSVKEFAKIQLIIYLANRFLDIFLNKFQMYFLSFISRKLKVVRF